MNNTTVLMFSKMLRLTQQLNRVNNCSCSMHIYDCYQRMMSCDSGDRWLNLYLVIKEAEEDEEVAEDLCGKEMNNVYKEMTAASHLFCRNIWRVSGVYISEEQMF